MAEPQVLELPLQSKTLMKLRLLAVASGKTITDLESQLSDLVDRAISQELHSYIDELDGMPTQPRFVTTPAAAQEINDHVDDTLPPPAQPEKKSFAALHKRESAGKPLVAAEKPAQPDKISGHELSDDEPEGEVLSLDEQVARDMSGAAPAAPKKVVRQNALGEEITAEDAAAFAVPLAAPDSGGDPEAFAAAALDTPPAKPTQAPPKRVNTPHGKASVAKQAYANKPRVKISGISEDEEEADDYFF